MKLKYLKKLSSDQVEQISNLHFKILNESFINEFGLDFVRLCYKSISNYNDHIIIILEENKKIYGFLVAASNGELFNQKIISRNFFKFLRHILRVILKKPILILWLLTGLPLPFKITSIRSELKFIAIDPSFQGKGWGSKMVKYLNKMFKQRAVLRFKVGTKVKNELSNKFYKKMGFSLIYTENIFGDKFNYYSSSPLPPKPSVSFHSLLFFILIFFSAFFIFKSILTMTFVPFYDFDEAHRAENAKRMKEYHSFFVPLTGSGFDRVEHLKIPMRDNPFNFLYYHLERPFFVYLTMIISTTVFGQSELVYRLPSFIFGLFTFAVLVIFIKKDFKLKSFSFLTAMVSLLCSSDLWLSSQYAQMDTGLTFFLFISLVTMILFVKTYSEKFLFLSGLSFALATLSKGQPAIIFIFPLAFLIFIKKINAFHFLRFILYSSIFLLPWFFYLIFRFGLYDVIKIFIGFAFYSASIIYSHQVAPFFWYTRWWWESLRPAWSLFLAFSIYDFSIYRINWQKALLLTYILGGLIAFSIPVNKIWWYILPLIPAISLYIYYSVRDYLYENPHKLINLAIVILIASLPIFLRSTNTVSLIYGLTTVLILILVLRNEFSHIFINSKYLFIGSIIASLVFFSLRFPEIIPYHWNTESVSKFYKALSNPKCLWIYDMPSEAVLFYSDAGEVYIFNESYKPYGHCKNYLITPETAPKTLLPNEKIIIQRGRMKLIEL